VDVESLSRYWETFPNLRGQLFKGFRDGFDALTIGRDDVSDTIFGDAEFSAYADTVESAFEKWKAGVDGKLRAITSATKPKLLIADIAEEILTDFEPVALVDKYDAYEVLLSYWNETMSDDVYLLVQDGYKAIRDIEVFTKTTTKKKGDTEVTKTTETGWDGKLVPKALVIEMFFAAEQKAIDDMETVLAAAQAELDEMVENAEGDSVINDVLKDNGNIDKPGLKKKLKDKELDADDKAVLTALQTLVTRVDEGTKAVKDLRAALDKKTREQYPKLTDTECVELLLNSKWYRTIISGVYALYAAVSHRISDRVTELNERYEQTLPELNALIYGKYENGIKVENGLEDKVKSHLERMGFAW
jgi:type I restriction enzyme M protein